MKIERMDVDAGEGDHQHEEEEEEALQQHEAGGNKPRKVYLPGKSRALKDGEFLDYDPAAYRFLHTFETALPCLSFDVLADGLGQKREQFPLSFYLVAGTQGAEKARDNELLVMGIGNVRPDEEEKDEEKSDEDDESSDEEDEKEAQTLPHFHSAIIPNYGGINRVKAQRLAGSGENVVAVWNESRGVQIWALNRALAAVDAMDGEKATEVRRLKEEKPLFTFAGHLQAEGYALGWSPTTNGDLVSGDQRGKIFLWRAGEAGHWAVDQRPLTDHTSSVEDLQWSPTETALLVSASVDRSIRLWDIRSPPKEACVCVVENAHDSDVNVLSWNRFDSSLVVSGGDDGALNIWSLKTIQYKEPVARFRHHTKPVTGVEWSPWESTTFAASGEDDQVSFWDLALESDEAPGGGQPAAGGEGEDGQSTAALKDLPPQLLFIHMGQKEIKEVHWHAQVPGLVVTTALDGFNVFRTINL